MPKNIRGRYGRKMTTFQVGSPEFPSKINKRVIPQTALLVAVTANQPEIVQDLLLLGADINACDVHGQTALHLAVHYGFPRVVQVKHQNGPRYPGIGCAVVS